MIVFLVLASIGWVFIYNFQSMHYPWLSDATFIQVIFCWAYFMLCFIIFEPKKNSININFDGVFRHRQISAKEDYSFGFLRILFSKNGLISIVLAIILANISVDLRRDKINKQKQNEIYRNNQPADQSTIQQKNN